MKNMFQYVYYRLVIFYKNSFGIKDSPGFLIQSCYDWGSQVLNAVICFYLLAIETLFLWVFGMKMKIAFVLITMLPFFFLHVFSEMIFGDEVKRFESLELKYKNDKLRVLKGVLIAMFSLLSLPCFILAMCLCK